MRLAPAAVLCVLASLWGCRCGETLRPGGCGPESGEVRVALASLPNTLDWSRSSPSSAENYPVILAMMRGLTTLDEQHRVAPGLASSWEVRREDGREIYTFHLRDGVVWSDGRTPLVARDFVYAWRRALLGREPGPLVDLVGAEEVLEARAKAPEKIPETLENMGVRALDARTLEVSLKGPRNYFLQRLANVYVFFPQPSSVLEPRFGLDIPARWFDEPGDDHPLVLGAFRVSSWDKLGRTLRLVANEHDAVRSADAPRSILLVEVALGPVLYERCQVDVLMMDDPTMLARAGAALRHTELIGTVWLGINADKVPLPLRRAIRRTIHRDALMDGLVPNPRLAIHFLPPSLNPSTGGDGIPDEPFTPPSEPLTLLIRSARTFLPERGIAEGLRRQLGAAGIPVNVVETSNFTDEIQTKDGKVRHALFLRRTGADYAHPESLLSPFRSNGVNYTGFASLEGGLLVGRYEALLAEGAAASDPAEAQRAFTAAERLLTDESAVVVPLYHPDRYYRTRDWIRGLGVDAFNFLSLSSTRLGAMP